ncbi:O-antigen ligase family protein [Candidatus Viridilinea mediisalina]|uniref:Polymerase n=1 Tax=Candidatus Viridilinea mediisalina TaxID=2024553 RepID=A0A2A6RE19_9CHLR|nr:O-antigen ligase family protein [Candidatus Viridilinea mediisalina]PDW00551.1 polymerase [Candidatus Viridilinea mediisalina]
MAITLRTHLAQSPALAAAMALATGGLVGGAAAFGPLYALAGIFGLLVGLAMLTSTTVGILAVFAIITILPFGTLPFRAIITPNFLTLALVALSAVWVLRMLARPDAYDLRVTPLGLPIFGFLGLTFFSLILGARGLPDTSTLHNYVKFTLGVLLFISIVNCVRTRAEARTALRGLLISGGIAAFVGLALWAMSDRIALQILVALGRIGYPTSGRVLRYVEDDVHGLERAIGFSVDPNSFGGMLALIVALGAAQLVAQRPIMQRWLLGLLVATMSLALILTFSRTALIGLIAAAAYLATLRYRRLWWLMLGGGVLGGILLLALGFADEFINRFISGIQFRDQAQQMRLAEYENALAIIARYPAFGIGFGQAPDLDLTAGVSSIYLAIGQRIGLIGLAAFLATVATWFYQTIRALPQLDEERSSWVLGCQAGIVAALAVGIADHYFFNIEFSHMVALFWGTMGLGMAMAGDLEESG